jgi:hypothetical protein
MPLLWTKSYLNFFLFMETPHRLITLSACVWSTFSCLLLVKAAGLALSHWLEKVANSVPPFLITEES